MNLKVSHAEKQLQDLIEQVRQFEQVAEKSDKLSKRKKTLNEVLIAARRLQSTVDHSHVMLCQVQRHFADKEDRKSCEGDAGEVSHYCFPRDSYIFFNLFYVTQKKTQSCFVVCFYFFRAKLLLLISLFSSIFYFR